MSPASKTFLFDLLSTPSPTGFEVRGQRKWMAYARQFADRVEHDAYGSAWAVLEGAGEKPPVVMFEAHADEIGWQVKYISGSGFIHLERLGGSDTATARGRRVDILGDKGTVRGVIGNIAIHMREKEGEVAPKLHELWIDIGAGCAADVERAGIRVGHPAVYADVAEMMGGHHLIGRAIDNRIGGYMIAEVIARLSKRENRLPATVMALNAVQEEVGGHGARMAAHRHMPDVAIILDVSHATDTPGVDMRQHGEVYLGSGPCITHGGSKHPEVVRRLLEVAGEKGIPFQHEALSRTTGTDTDAVFNQRHGIPSALVSLPLRYMHSVVETVDLRDVEQMIDLLVAFAESVRTADGFGVKL